MVSQTSILAYKEVEPKLGHRQRAVLEALETLGTANNKEIAQYLDWEINRVTGRVNELRTLKKIEIAYKGRSAEGRTVQFYRVKEE